MTIALDVGAFRVRSLRCAGDRLVARSTRSVCAVLPDTAAHRRLLDQASLRYARCEDGLILLGDDAVEHAGLFQVDCRPLLPGGRPVRHDPLARQLLAAVIEAVLPPADRRGELCSVALPGGLNPDDPAAAADIEFLMRVIRLRGWEPLPVPAAQALILAELSDRSFTGLGIVLGASGIELALTHRAVILGLARLPHRNEAAERTSGDGPAARSGSSGRNSRPGTDADGQPAPDGVVSRLFSELALTLNPSGAATGLRLPEPLALICQADPALEPGLRRAIERTLKHRPLPWAVDRPRSVAQPEFSVARGLLLAAELETLTAASGAPAEPMTVSA